MSTLFLDFRLKNPNFLINPVLEFTEKVVLNNREACWREYLDIVNVERKEFLAMSPDLSTAKRPEKIHTTPFNSVMDWFR